MAEGRSRGETAHTIVVDNSLGPPQPLVYPQEALRAMLSKHELEIFDVINQARTNPAATIERLEELRPYYSDDMCFRYPGEPIFRTKEGVAALDSAIADLKKISANSLAPIALWKGLIYSCRDHIADQWLAEDSPSGHKGTDGSSPQARATRYGDWGLQCGHCLNYGDKDPFRIIAYFLIDDGRPERPHRGYLFKNDIRCAGVASGAHRKCGMVTSILLSDTFEEDKAIETDWVRDATVASGYKKAAKKHFWAKNEMVTKTKVTHQGKNPNKKKGFCAVM